jgi:hypothetical protein
MSVSKTGYAHDKITDDLVIISTFVWITSLTTSLQLMAMNPCAMLVYSQK